MSSKPIFMLLRSLLKGWKLKDDQCLWTGEEATFQPWRDDEKEDFTHDYDQDWIRFILWDTKNYKVTWLDGKDGGDNKNKQVEYYKNKAICEAYWLVSWI